MSRRGRLASDPIQPDINLTPLIDVVFVILIMFMVVAPLLDLDKVDLAASGGTAEVSSVNEKSPITIHVQSNNGILLNRRLVRLDELRSLLKEGHAQHPTVIPQVFHDRRAQFGTYQEVKNAVEQAGFDRMDIVLKPG